MVLHCTELHYTPNDAPAAAAAAAVASASRTRLLVYYIRTGKRPGLSLLLCLTTVGN
jgi:hypothetical protein